MSSWNTKSVMYDEIWLNASDLDFLCDSSDIGYGAVLGSNWLSGKFSADQKSQSIEWRELFAIVVACRTWGHLLSGRRILIY